MNKDCQSKPGSLLLWVVFLLLDGLIAYGISEAWIREFVPVKNVCYFVDRKIGVRYCPNQRTYGHVEEGYSNILVTNSLGFHDIERTQAKDPGVFRIHMYGDSLVAGLGVQIEETIPSIVEKWLNEQSVPIKIEVLNMASGAEGAGGQIMTYEKIGRYYDADLVVYYFMDDFYDNIYALSLNKHAPYFYLDETGALHFRPPVPKNTSTFTAKLKRNSQFYNLVKDKVLESQAYNYVLELYRKISFALNSAGTEGYANGIVAYAEHQKRIYINEAWPLTLRLIQLFKNKVAADGAPFILVDGRRFDKNGVGSVYNNEDLERFCKQNGIYYIPAYKVMSRLKRARENGSYFFVDGHPNQKGNRELGIFVAREIFAYLTQKQIL